MDIDVRRTSLTSYGNVLRLWRSSTWKSSSLLMRREIEYRRSIGLFLAKWNVCETSNWQDLWKWNDYFGIASEKSTWATEVTRNRLQTCWILENKSPWHRTRVVVQVGHLERIPKSKAPQSPLLPWRLRWRHHAIYRWRNDFASGTWSESLLSIDKRWNRWNFRRWFWFHSKSQLWVEL